MDIHLLEILNQELLKECKNFQKYLNDFNELPGNDSDFGNLMGVLTDRFIGQQLNEIKRFQKRGEPGDRESCKDLAFWAVEAMETRKLFN
jgi:hypothetical protein